MLLFWGWQSLAFSKTISCKVSNSSRKYPPSDYFKNHGVDPSEFIDETDCNSKGCKITAKDLRKINKACIRYVIESSVPKEVHSKLSSCEIVVSGIERDISWTQQRQELSWLLEQTSKTYARNIRNFEGKVLEDSEIIKNAIYEAGKEIYRYFFAKYNRSSEEKVLMVFDRVFKSLNEKSSFKEEFDPEIIFSPSKEKVYTELWGLFIEEDHCAKIRQASSTFSRAVVNFSGVFNKIIGVFKDTSYNLYAEEKYVSDKELDSYLILLKEDPALKLNEDAIAFFKKRGGAEKLIKQSEANKKAAKKRVFTVLFGGTGSNLSDAKKYGTYFQGEIISKTAQLLKAGDPRGDFIRYLYVPGVGSSNQGYHTRASNYQYRDQYSNVTGVAFGAGMRANVEEALAMLTGSIANPSLSGKIQNLNYFLEVPELINVAGWSRGAVTSVLFSSAIAEMSKFDNTDLNLFALDPVPGGDKTWGISNMRAYEDEIAILTPRVRNAVILFAAHEYTRAFLPVLPAPVIPSSIGATALDIIIVPGNHSVLVGNAYQKESLYDLSFLTRHMLADFLMKNGVGKKGLKELLLEPKALKKRHELLLKNIESYVNLEYKSLLGAAPVPLKARRNVMIHSSLLKLGVEEVSVVCLAGPQKNPSCQPINSKNLFDAIVTKNVKTLSEYLNLGATPFVDYIRKKE